MMETPATLLQDQEPRNLLSGIYIVHSTARSYYPAMALIAMEKATFLGENYDAEGRWVTFRVGSTSLAGPGSYEGQITIGRDFFINALKDYSDWEIKWWREVVQNAVDAGATTIKIGTEDAGDDQLLVYCEDNGRGMDEDTLVNKFLVLGGTTKVDGDTAGGFGKAKELILLPWRGWKISSRDIVVEGVGISYTVDRAKHRTGTRVEVLMPEDKTTRSYHAKAFLAKCNLPGIKFTVDWARVEANLQGRDLTQSVQHKADIYFTPTEDKQSYLYVRTKGLFMFERYVGEIPGYLFAELTAPSIEILAANRDGFRDREVGYAIDNLARTIAKDNLSALKNRQGMIRQKFEGAGKFRARQRAANMLEKIGPTPSMVQVREILEREMDTYAREREYERDSVVASLPPAPVVEALLSQKIEGPVHLENAIKQLAWEPDFFIINEVEGFRVPSKFFPATMTPTVLKLAKVWVELCRFVLIQLGSDTKYGVGFIFSRDTAAAAVEEDDAEHWIMLNPFKDMGSRTKIWSPLNSGDLKWLYAAAIHEATHVADGISYHDESFASALTFNMAKCADGYRQIRKIAAGIKMRGSAKADD